MNRTRRPSLWCTGLLVLLAPLVTAGAQRVAAAQARYVSVGALARIPAGARDVGALAASAELSVGLALRVRDPASLAAYAAGVSTPGSPRYHRFISPAAFASRFGPGAATLRAVTSALRRIGLQPGPIPADHLIVPIRARAGSLERALQTHLEAYHLASGGLGWIETRLPELPASIAGDVSAVLGLDQVVTPHALAEVARQVTPRVGVRARPHVRIAGAPHGCAAATGSALSGSGWTPDQLARAYGLNSLYARGDFAAGQSVAVVELEPFSLDDLATFDRCFFGVSRRGQVNVTAVDGFALNGAGTDEAALDVEELAALAPSATLDVYEAPNTTFGTIDEYAQIVSQDRANIVSTSWGECESALIAGAPGAIQVENTLFEEAAAEGQTWFAAAGDEGSDDCAGTRFSSSAPVAPYLSVDDPGAQPYVVSVGGTSLTSDRPPLLSSQETVWNDGANAGGGGGGYSGVWPMPSWQADGAVPGLNQAPYRATPDVSASADQARGVVIYSSGFAAPLPAGLLGGHRALMPGGWTTIGGTSAAAPLWAAVAAETAGSGPTGTACARLPANAGGTDLGFLAPLLYEVAALDYTSNFNDVRVGNNDVFGNGLGYAAGPGYDLASGLGSPVVASARGPGLAANLCAAASGTSLTTIPRPAITGIAPTYGPTAGGNQVTVTLAAPPPSATAVHVTVGPSPATAVEVAGNTVTFVAPPAVVASGSPSFAGAGPATISVSVSGAGSTSTSAAGSSSIYDYVNEQGPSRVPTVTGVGPDVGNVAGGVFVTVFGSGFAGSNDSVTFGGIASPSVTAVSDYALRAEVPAKSASTNCATGIGFDSANACQVEVVVSNADGTSATSPILPGLSGPVVFSPLGVVEASPETEIAPAATEFDYSPTPRITSIKPALGDAAGRVPVTISGSGFNINTFDWINFGPPSQTQSEQIEESFISGSRIVIVPPAATVDGPRLAGGVSVQTGGGLSNVVRFGYAGVPKVLRLSRRSGPATGGTIISIEGSDLAGVTSVRFVTAALGGTFSQSVSSEMLTDSRTRLVIVAPAAVAGKVDVEPCTATGCALANPRRDSFVFYSVSPPLLSAVSPESGPAAGGNVVTLRGSNLTGASEVLFGSSVTRRFAAPNGFPQDSPTELAVVVPAGTPGTRVKVRIITRAGRSPLVDAPTYRYA